MLLEPHSKSRPGDRKPQGSVPQTIGEIARRTGVPASTLRYYERTGLLPQPQRESGRRRYGEEAVLQIALIQLARQAGFTLSEIHDLYGDFRDPQQMGIGFQRMAPGKLAELDELIRAAEGMKALLEEGLRAECVTLEECAIVSRVIEGFRG